MRRGSNAILSLFGMDMSPLGQVVSLKLMALSPPDRSPPKRAVHWAQVDPRDGVPRERGWPKRRLETMSGKAYPLKNSQAWGVLKSSAGQATSKSHHGGPNSSYLRNVYP